MKQKTKFFLGIDVSKPFFDVALMAVVDHEKQAIQTSHFDNSEAGMKSFWKWLKSSKVTMNENTLLVIENTGVYHRLLWAFCSQKGLPIHIGNAAHIKRSFGIARGKNDKVDSIRLCQYACRNAEDLLLTGLLDPVLMKLKDLTTARTRLITQKNSIKVFINELKNINDKSVQHMMQQAHKNAIDGITKSIAKVEAEIKKIIKENEAIKKNYNLIITVPGIGHVTAVYLICCTSNFAGNRSGKQLACYAGIAPFENSSGISIKGKEKVHPMANKDLKKLLFLGAMSGIQFVPEYKKYYERKVESGKHKMSVLNAIKNKILLRVAVVVRNQKPYVNYFQAA